MMRNFKSFLLSAIVLPLVFGGIAYESNGAERLPNIIYVMVDDMGWGDAGCYGQKQIKTPHIDRLAAEGTRFTNVYAGASVCAPSRCVLMTGKHLGNARIRGNAGMVGGVGSERRVPLEPEDTTVAMYLKKAGYVTGITGKWGLAEPGTAGTPNKKGFDEWFGYLNQNHAALYYTDYLWKNEERVTLEGNLNGQKTQYTHDLFADFALDFVTRHREQPFFLYAAWTLPHAEYIVPSLETYGGKDWPENYKIHAAMVTRLDRDLGRLLDRLTELKLDDKTIVFFCSDNGGVDRREGVLDSVGPFRGKKGNQTEGGLRVPMIVRWLGHIAANQVNDRPWYYADVLPTLCSLAQFPPPSDVDGLNVLPTLLGEHQSELDDRMMYWEQYSGGFLQTVRWGKWKGHFMPEKNKFELYDLTQDLQEEVNVAHLNPEVVARMKVAMEKFHTPSPNWLREGTTKKKSKPVSPSSPDATGGRKD